MTITFLITTDADLAGGPVATIDRGQCTAFLAFLDAEAPRIGVELVDPSFDRAEPFDTMIRDGLEARVCPLALATVARIFHRDPDVISTVEDAQTRGRKLVIWGEGGAGPIHMCASMTTDVDAEFMVPTSDGFVLVDCLGLGEWNQRSRPADDVLRLLTEPATRDRIAAQGVAGYLPSLERLLDTARGQPSANLGWVSSDGDDA